MKAPLVQIDAGQFASLSTATRREVEEALNIINDPPYLPGGVSDYKNAWKTLLKKFPRNTTVPLVARTFAQMPSENLLRRGLFDAFLEGVNFCFSSADFERDMDMDPRDFLHQPLESRRGGEYAPLIAASLRKGKCSPDQVVAILHDVAHINSPYSRKLLEEIGANHWYESPEFARAYLNLAHLINPPEKTWTGPPNSPEQVAFADRLREAMILLIPESKNPPLPEDEKLIHHALLQALGNLFKKDRDAFFGLLVNNPKVKAQPALGTKLREWADIDLRRSL